MIVNTNVKSKKLQTPYVFFRFVGSQDIVFEINSLQTKHIRTLHNPKMSDLTSTSKIVSCPDIVLAQLAHVDIHQRILLMFYYYYFLNQLQTQARA